MLQSDRIRLVHLITGLEIGGAERMLVKLVTHMDRARFDNLVVSMAPFGPLAGELRDSGIPVASLGIERNQVLPRGLFRLVGLLRGAAILQTWLYHSDLLGTLAGTIAGTPTVLWNLRCSDMDMSAYRLRSRIVLALLVRLSRFQELVLANSRAAKEAHERLGYRPHEWRIVPNGFDLSRFRPDREARAAVRRELGVAESEILIGLPARFDPMKDHGTFFRAAGRLARDGARIRFVAFGKDVARGNAALDELVRSNGVAQSTLLLGVRDDVPRLLNALDICTLCSAFGEGFPNVLGEAMATEIPCVGTSVGDVPEILGATGKVVPPRNPEALAAAWRGFIDAGAEARAAAGAAARKRVIEKFSLEDVVRQYEELFAEIARRRAPRDGSARTDRRR
ncbi:MAG TPA: glycosyltransferase [Alphaproteobacteria bacterium]|nr:glycosyltransferase [Alphaproteobacteria bacterium]